MVSTLFRDMTLKTRLIAGFAFVLALTWGFGIVATDRLQSILGISQTVYEHPLAVSNAALEVKADVSVMAGVFDHLLFSNNPHEAERLKLKIASLQYHIKEMMKIVAAQFLGNPGDVTEANQALSKWNRTYEEIAPLLEEGETAEARLLYNARVAEIEALIDLKIGVIVDFARAKAATLSRDGIEQVKGSQRDQILLLVGLSVIGLLTAIVITTSITHPLATLRDRMVRLAEGERSLEVPFRDDRNELGRMAGAVQVFRESAQRLDDQRWIKGQSTALSAELQVAESLESFATALLDRLVPLLGGSLGLLYFRAEGSGRYLAIGSYGCGRQIATLRSFGVGEGLPGQCIASRHAIYVEDVPDDYLIIGSGLGAAAPKVLALIPLVTRDDIPAVLEIASFGTFTELQRELLDQLMPMITLNITVCERNFKTRQLLEQSQRQAEILTISEARLTVQADELGAANERLMAQTEELESQTEELRASEEELRVQQEQLRAVNEELSEKTEVLEDQAKALKLSQSEAEQRALELALASRYKSEFLANMSHELRTPLNSLLILAKSLADNDGGNLNHDQIESAEIIHDSGTQLLNLINDILDIAKVESGKMRVALQDVPLPGIADTIGRRFRSMARVKGLEFSVLSEPETPEFIRTDGGKFEQILNNLIGNAVKFTEHGSVTVTFARHAEGRVAGQNELAGDLVTVSVADTGIGISVNLIDRIFMAFEQGDGTTSRRFGGTGLGLSIARKLARLLGGDIFVQSVEGKGSTFTLVLPATPPVADLAEPLATHHEMPARPGTARLSSTFVPDDRDKLTVGDKIMLVIDDDRHFAKITANAVREKGFKCLVAGDGETGIALAQRFHPAGIALDIGLPDLDGWAVMERLHAKPETASIPVHIISASEGSARAREFGAVGCLTKPVTAAQIDEALGRIVWAGNRKAQLLMIADGDPESRVALSRMIDTSDLQIVQVANGADVLARLRRGGVDCLVLDVDLPGGGLSLLEAVSKDEALTMPAVIVTASRELSRDETAALRNFTDSIIVKSCRSEERLLDEVRLFLHSVRATLPLNQRPQIALHVSEHPELAGRTVLVVDDDMRNSFALSKVLRARGLRVLLAQDGHKALAQLEANPGIDLVVMDIMMPGMDGYQATREIRRSERFSRIPIIAVTAKAMSGDREKCLEAGANDYLSKPVGIDALITMMSMHMSA